MAQRDHGLSRFDALIDSCSKRARPIVMTTIAMGAGMMPIALGWAGDPSFRAPMGVGRDRRPHRVDRREPVRRARRCSRCSTTSSSGCHASGASSTRKKTAPFRRSPRARRSNWRSPLARASGTRSSRRRRCCPDLCSARPAGRGTADACATTCAVRRPCCATICVGRLAFLDPVDHRRHGVVPIRADAAAAVRHAGHHEETHEVRRHSAVRLATPPRSSSRPSAAAGSCRPSRTS